MLRVGAAALAVGCVGLPPEPDPVRVEPAWGYRDDDTPVRVVGTSFYPSLDVPALGPDDGPDAGFTVALQVAGRDPVALVGVRLEDLNTLVGVVPRGVLPGTYDVAVRAPSGLVGVEPGAFEVRGTRVERVRLDVEAVQYEVFEEAPVTVRLVDGDGDPVAEDLPVVLTLRRVDGGRYAGTSRVEGFDDLERTATETLVTLRGRLGADGTATVYPLLQNPGDLEIDVAIDDDAVRIAGDDLRLAFTRGTALAVRVTLPSTDFRTVAGEPFPALLELVDQFGNVATDASATVAVTDSCASFATGVRITGSEDVTVVPTAATGTTRCTLNRLLVSGAGVSGTSAPFRVDAADAVGLDVIAGPPSVVAGDLVSAFVSAVDPWGNLAAWSGEVVVVDDDAGTLRDGACGEPDLLAFCTGALVRAGSRRLVVGSAEGLVGTSNTITVRAGPPARVEATAAATWVAGASEVVAPRLVDAWGNAAEGVSLDPFTVVASDPSGQGTCAPSGGGVLSCRLFEATPATTLTLATTVPGVGPVSGEVGPVRVRHAALARIDLAPGALVVPAGETVRVDGVARDTWGNPCVDEVGTAVRLSDTAGSGASVDVAVGADATLRADLPLYLAGTTRLVASVAERERGRSSAITVVAGPSVRLLVDWLAPWAWVGAPVGVRVVAVDLYGNRSALDDATVDVASRGALGAPVALAMVAGVATGTFTFDAWALDDALLAEVRGRPSLNGASVDRMLLRDCADGPEVDVRFAGLPYARACTDAEGDVSFAGDFAATVPGPGGTVVRYGLALDGEPVVDVAPRVALTTRRVGVRSLRGVVQQADGCGAEVVTSAYLGPDDGSAVGPVGVEILGIGDLDDVVPGVDVRVFGVTTCHGVPAAGAALRIRTDRGALVGVLPSGEGLELRTDSLGAARLRVDLGATDRGGPSRVTVTTPATTALGWAEHVVVGDARGPTVVAQTPKGAIDAPFDTFRVTFSEPLDAFTVTPLSVRVAGAAERPVALALEDEGRTLVVRVETPIPVDVGTSALVLEPILTDLAGRALDGAWGGVPGRYTGYFGDAGAPVLVTRCEVDRPVLRPDGDPGLVPEEGDDATLSFAAAETPVWWAVEVRDAAGAVVAARQIRATAAEAAWTWDARDLGGRIVPTGPYTLSVSAEDAAGNRANSCARSVVVDLVEP